MATVSIGVWVEEELKEWLREEAERQHRSLNNMINVILEDARERAQKEVNREQQ